jgi:transposase InsO family protein
MGEGGHGETEDGALVADPQEKVEARRKHYNTARPHGALGSLAPEDFVRAPTATATAVVDKTAIAVLT